MLTNEQIQEKIKSCRASGMPEFMILEHIDDLIDQEESEEGNLDDQRADSRG